MAIKAYTTFIQHLVTSIHYYPRPVDLMLTSGTGNLSIGLRETNQLQFEGVGAALTPTQARELANDILARVDEIEARP